MALASLKTRIERLQAKQRVSATKVRGVIGGEYSQMIVDPERPGHLKYPEPPGGFEKFASKQQARLLGELAALSGESGDVNEHNPHTVGITDQLSPLPPGQKRRRFIEIDGKEIDTFAKRGS